MVMQHCDCSMRTVRMLYGSYDYCFTKHQSEPAELCAPFEVCSTRMLCPLCFLHSQVQCNITFKCGLPSKYVPFVKVWWTVRADKTSKVCVYSVLDGMTHKLPCCGNTTAAVLSMSVDGSGRVWLSHQGGLLQVWCSLYHMPITQKCHIMLADVRSTSSPSVNVIVACSSSTCVSEHKSVMHLMTRLENMSSSQ